MTSRARSVALALAIAFPVLLRSSFVLAGVQALVDSDIGSDGPLSTSPQVTKKPCDRPANQTRPVQRALVLSGGGFRGAFEVGAVYHLVVHRECDFQDFAGVSTGALNAAYLAQAPSGPDSQKHLADQTKQLVDIWRDIHHSDQIVRPRLLSAIPGLLGIMVLNWEGAFYLDPLRALITKHIHLEQLSVSGRAVRVGVVSFWDETYREILFSMDDVLIYSQFLDYVLASAAMPVLTQMPRLRENFGQPLDDDKWAQFADGGVRHTTPIVDYFVTDEQQLPQGGPIVPYKTKAPPVVFKNEDPKQIPPHGLVEELFVVVTFPYARTGGGVTLPEEPDRHERSGRKILAKSHQLAVVEPTLWDLRFAHLANEILRWREHAYQQIKDVSFRTELNSIFPVESYNRPSGSTKSLPYVMRIVAPEQLLLDPLEGEVSKIISEQLLYGCLRANAILEKDFGNLSSRCFDDLSPGHRTP